MNTYHIECISLTISQDAGMAQSVAHFIGSEEVTGSIPVASLLRTLAFARVFLFLLSQNSVCRNLKCPSIPTYWGISFINFKLLSDTTP